MSSKADLLGEVKRLTGRDLHSEQWTKPELKELQVRAKTCLQLETDVLSVPLNPQKSLPDPRLSSREYLKLIFSDPRSEERIQSLGLRIEKLGVVLALEGTLIDIIDETPDSPRQVMLTHAVVSNSEKRLNIDFPELSKTVLLAVRKHSGRFLQSLKSFSQLFLVSNLPHKVVRKVLELLQWTDYFDDIVANAESRSIEMQFPQLAGSQLVFILEDRLPLWGAADWRFIVPSKAYFPLRRAAMTMKTLTYELGGGVKLVEALRETGNCLFEVEPTSVQLQRVEEKLRDAAFEAFANQYQQRPKKSRLKAYVEISDLQKRRIAEQIAKLLGWELQDLRSLADVVVGDQSGPDAYQRHTFTTLVQTFFNVDRRS